MLAHSVSPTILSALTEAPMYLVYKTRPSIKAARMIIFPQRRICFGSQILSDEVYVRHFI